jgi:(R,R)-butanediol dehydrogenase/meso-butanediol dehydrogenase/diacetyl reductase
LANKSNELLYDKNIDINIKTKRRKLMKALRWYGKKDLRIENIPEPKPGKDEVKIKVEWCGICGSDLHEYEAGPIFIPTTSPHPITGDQAPITMGHEFAGTIVEVGENVKDWKVGDRVSPDACFSCGTCDSCRRGDYHLCESLGFNGLAADNGGFAEYSVVPAYQLYKLAENVDFEEGALVEPISVGVHALKKARLMMGESVVIIGAGTIGLATLQAAKAAGAANVIVVELAAARKDFAKKMGADYVIDPSTTDLVSRIKEVNNGRLADVAIECVGLEATLKSSLDSIRKGGRAVIAGIFSASGKGIIDWNDLVIGEKELIGTIGYNRDFATSINLINSGKINAKQYITKRIKLEDAVEEGFEELIKNKDKHIKIIVEP